MEYLEQSLPGATISSLSNCCTEVVELKGILDEVQIRVWEDRKAAVQDLVSAVHGVEEVDAKQLLRWLLS